jgi:leucyl/phenylalanyl-tRNA--protein transferase
VQWLDKVTFPKNQRRYIFSPRFDVRFDTDFGRTIRACATRPNGEPTWINDGYIRAMTRLFEMGYAHSFEAWENGEMVGGAFGVQLGSMMTCDSMFHTVSNSSKAVWGQLLIHLRNRGYRLVDTNGVATHQVQYGEEWVREWRFTQLIAECVRGPWPTLTDSRRYATRLPWAIRTGLPVMRLWRKIDKRAPAGDDQTMATS